MAESRETILARKDFSGGEGTVKNPSAQFWIGLLGSFVVGVAVSITFAYGQFETKDESNQTLTFITQRLDRIEGKLDALWEAQKK